MKTPDGSLKAVLSAYSDVLREIGCFLERRTGKTIQAKLAMEPDAEPVVQKLLPAPCQLQKPYKGWHNQGVKDELFEKVPDEEAITWCSS